MSIIDTIKNLFTGAQSKLPDNLNSVGELKDRGQELATEYGDTANKAVDTIQEKVPGEAGDNFIDATQDTVSQFVANDKK